MKTLLQRVKHAAVHVDKQCVGTIEYGLLVFLGFEKFDNSATLGRMRDKLLAYRVFPDELGKMNCNVQQVNGGVLAVSQFTLAADTRKGLRPSFSSAAPPDQAITLYDEFLKMLRDAHSPVASGRFGANMQVSLVNDGPVTFLLEISPKGESC